MDTEQAIQIFEWGIDYGLLLAEGERDSEDLFDAVGCAAYARKRNIPSSRAPRRQPRSAAWRKAKLKGLLNLIGYVRGNHERQ